MESLELRFKALREFIAKELGSRSSYDPKTFGSSHAIAGEMSHIARLPSIATAPAQDLVTGQFYFMADYDPIDGGNPIG